MAFSLRQLRYFVAAAEHGEVSAAARALSISQPSVSAAIADLEGQFGVQLFLRRHAQGMALTPAGRRLLPEARSLLDHAREFESGAAGLGQALAGTLEVGCFVTIAPFFVPRLLSGIRARHPGMDVRVTEGHHEELPRGLKSGAFELALLYDYAVGADRDLVAEPLAEFQPYILLPKGHRLARAAKLSLADLAREPLVLLDLPSTREYFLSRFIALGIEPLVAHRTPSYEMVRCLVANGHGYSMLNMRPAEDLTYDGKRLVCRPIKDPLVPARVVLVRLAGATQTRRAAIFAEFTRDFFAKEKG